MDAHELKFATKWTKRLEKEIVNLDARLHSEANHLKTSKFTKTIKNLHLSVQKLSYHAPTI